ncbi:hypothetical protein O3G_MSEX013719 [Manduca sexta]|nr:hypothetical protein O3G_MSEX013719 [Manduca sexta]
MEPYAFEAVAVVPNSHNGGLEGLRGGKYCHPGLDQVDLRWSPRVLKTLEQEAARTDRCPTNEVAGRTAEDLEVETLSTFFSAACRPGMWSTNSSVDLDLKSKNPSLCSLCGVSASCSGYSIDMGINIAGVRNENRHIQALECMRVNNNDSTPVVAYAAWLHVREFFNLRNPQDAGSYSLLCPNGTLSPLNADALNRATAPCSFVKQPWGAIVASTSSAPAVLNSLRTWWPNGADPGSSSWQSVLFGAVAGGANARVVFEDAPISPANYTGNIRPMPNVESVVGCLPARRWCTRSAAEQSKCSWIRSAAHSLGLQPSLACLQRASVFECLEDIKNERADFISAPSNYGYIARSNYNLAPVKMVQNGRAAQSRIAAFVKEAAAQENITRFENLRDKNACFPEFGGLAYVAFIRVAHERSVISRSQCDYAQAAGEFFGGACAPGAVDASHAINPGTSFNASVLCSTCRLANGNVSDFTCAWDYSNRFYGNNGSLACLADPRSDFAVLNLNNIGSHLSSVGLQANQLRALCSNNTLAATPGVTVDDNCLLANVVDAEVLARRGDPLYNALNAFFDSLDLYFGYNAATGTQLINFEIFSSFDGISDLLFKDSTIGLTEPSIESSHLPARNYMELFAHLDACNRAPGVPDFANRITFPLLTTIVMALLAQIIH